MSGWQTAGMRSSGSVGGSAAIQTHGRFAERGEQEGVGLLLAPFEAGFLSINADAKIIVVARSDLAGPKHPAGAFLETQKQLGIVVETPAGNEDRNIGGNLPAVQAGNEAKKIVSVGADISETASRTA